MNTDEPIQQELPFTKVPNIFLDEWVNALGLVEIRIVAAIIRRTFGWHRKKSEPISVTELCQITRRSRPLVVKALCRLREFGILDRFRLSRQEPYGYGLIMRSEFNALRELPPPVKQRALPYDVHQFSGKENLTTENISVVKEPLLLSGKENLTTEPAVLRSVKESRSKETHTPNVPVENIGSGVCADQPIDRHRYKKYARAHPRIDDANAWATVAERTRQWDADVLEWEAQRAAWEAQRAAELERQRLEFETWHAVETKPAATDASADPIPRIETAEERSAREKREEHERRLQQRGEQILADLRQRRKQTAR